MSLLSTMYASSSALTNFGNALGVVSNNLSNANTLGFKGSKVSFSDSLAQSIGSTPAQGSNQVGNGVKLNSVFDNANQGSMEFTNSPLDIAVDGVGFFVLRDFSLSTIGTDYYSRAGDFKINKDGYLVNSADMRVQGKALIDDNGILKAQGAPASVQLANVTASSKQPTSTVTVAVSLDAEQSPPITTPYDPNDPSTYNFSTSVRLYDSLGTGHNVDIQFVKLATPANPANSWAWHPVVATNDLVAADRWAGAVSPVDLTTANAQRNTAAAPAGADYTPGRLEFSSSGFLVREGSTPITFNWGNGGEPQDILFNFGDAIGTVSPNMADSTNDFQKYGLDPAVPATYLQFNPAAGAANADLAMTGAAGTVQFAAGFSTISLAQDGFPAGFLQGISVDNAGRVFGSFSNGKVKPLYQLLLARFANPQGLDKVGNNLYQETYIAGAVITGAPNSGEFGQIRSNALEQSNVDLPDEFIRMIALQRSFQANSRIVSITDGMMEEMVNLKR